MANGFRQALPSNQIVAAKKPMPVVDAMAEAGSPEASRWAGGLRKAAAAAAAYGAFKAAGKVVGKAKGTVESAMSEVGDFFGNTDDNQDLTRAKEKFEGGMGVEKPQKVEIVGGGGGGPRGGGLVGTATHMAGTQAMRSVMDSFGKGTTQVESPSGPGGPEASLQ